MSGFDAFMAIGMSNMCWIDLRTTLSLETGLDLFGAIEVSLYTANTMYDYSGSRLSLGRGIKAMNSLHTIHVQHI